MRRKTIRDIAILPNLISAVRLPLAAAFPLVTHEASALALIGAAGMTDLLDGYSARKLGQTTPLGAAIDGFADKAFGVSLLVTLVARGVLAPASAVLLATRELFELPLAIWVLANPTARVVAVDRAANRIGKLATAVQLSAVIASITRSRVATPLVVVAGIAGAVAGVSYWLRELRAEHAYAAITMEKDLPVPYLLAGGHPDKRASFAA